MALTLNVDNFETKVLSSNGVALVDFWAVWCGPCRAIAPAVEQLSEEFAGRAVVGKVNVDDSPEISVKYGIRNIPTLLFFKDGKVVDKQVGAVPKSVLRKKLEKHLS